MGAVVRAALYVPNPPHEFYWLGKPTGTALVLLAALSGVPTFFGAPGQSVQKMWRVDPGQDHFWRWTPPNRSTLSLGTYPVNSFVIQEVPEEPVGWVGRPKPVPLVLNIQAATVLPFSIPRRFDTQPEPGWVGDSSPTPWVMLTLPAQPPFTVRGTQQFNIAVDPPWTGKSTSVLTLLSLPAIVKPFIPPTWNFNVPEIIPWTTGGRRSSTTQYQQPSAISASFAFTDSPDVVSISMTFTPKPSTASPIPRSRWDYGWYNGRPGGWRR